MNTWKTFFPKATYRVVTLLKRRSNNINMEIKKMRNWRKKENLQSKYYNVNNWHKYLSPSSNNFYFKDARSVSLYPYNQSQILQNVKYT